MAVEHVNITDPEIHEPKGVASASAGQIYTADGAGSGNWASTQLDVHGQMDIIGNSTTLPTTAAADSTLNTDSDYSKVSGVWQSPVGTVNTGVSFSVDKLVVPTAGTYYLNLWMSFTSPNSSVSGFKFAINDTTPYSVPKLKRSSTASTDWGVASAHTLLDLSANDTISLYYANTVTNATGILIEDAVLSITLVST